MRNKVLQLIYKQLETPTVKSSFSYAVTPFRSISNTWIMNHKVLSFTLSFKDGHPDIIVTTNRTFNIRFLNWSCGPRYLTTVKCHPLEFDLTESERIALTQYITDFHEKHLALVYAQEFELMKDKVENRLKND